MTKQWTATNWLGRYVIYLLTIVHFVGKYKLKRNTPQMDKDSLTWTLVLESVAHKLPTKFPFLTCQSGFKSRSFVKLLSTIVNEYVQLCDEKD